VRIEGGLLRIVGCVVKKCKTVVKTGETVDINYNELHHATPGQVNRDSGFAWQ
jgi:hypothetical protein